SSVLAISIAGDASRVGWGAAVVIPTMLYGLAAVLFWVLVEARARSVRKAVDAWRLRRDARVKAMVEQRAAEAAHRTSVPSTPPPQRKGDVAPAESEAAKLDDAAPKKLEEPPSGGGTAT